MSVRSTSSSGRNNPMSSSIRGKEEGQEIMIPKLAWTEITLGRTIGEGGFCTVRDITAVDLDEVYDTDDLSTKYRVEFAKLANTSRQGYGCQFVLKTLRTDLNQEEHVKGVLDLAIEADFLSVLAHENIIQMRATANSDPHESRYFVVLERLQLTLERRFNQWRGAVGANSGYWIPLFGYCCSNTVVLHGLWKERIKTAKDVSKALEFLHQQNIVYRDLKPDNIGFNSAGVLKLFDFGLAKRLDSSVEQTSVGLYRLTGNTGSLRYMAPEVAKDQPYDLSVDIYSFGIIFWQLCSLITPYAGYSQKHHAEKVIRGGERPPIDPTWPAGWRELMEKCWDSSSRHRPDSSSIVKALSELYDELCQDEDIIPTRASEIKAKLKRAMVLPGNRASMDVDTRIAQPNVSKGQVKRFDTDII